MAPRDEPYPTASLVMGPVLEFPVRRPPFWSRRLVWTVAGLSLVAWMVSRDLPPPFSLLTFAAAAALSTVAVLGRLLARRRPPAPIRVHPEGLELPRAVGSARSFRLPWAKIHTFEARGDEQMQFLLIAGAGRTLVLPSMALERPEQFGQMYEAMTAGLARQPDSQRVFARMTQGREAMKALLEVKPKVTHALLAAIGVAYLLQIAWAADQDPLGLVALVELGGNVKTLVAEGQIDRLVTANFLHGNFLHIGLNALALWLLGGLMERLLGHWRYFIVYVLSAIGGAVASAWGSQGPISVGASTGILGIFGALAVVHLAHLRSIPPAVRQPLRWWLLIVGINLAISLAIPQIDDWGHGGGLVTGMLVTFVLTLGWPPLDRSRSKERAVRPIAALLLLVVVAGLGASGYRAVVGGQADLGRLARAAARVDDPDAELLNYFAWMVAVGPGASEETLRGALEAAERAREIDPDSREIIDTVAQLHWRLGELDRAIELERRALGGEPVGTAHRSMYATQLARFLERRIDEQGPIGVGEDVPELSFEVRDGKLHTTMRGEPPPTGLVAYVVVERGDPLPWLLRIRLGPDARPPEVHDLRERWPDGMRAHTAIVDTTVEVPRGIGFRVEEYPPDGQVAGLP